MPTIYVDEQVMVELKRSAVGRVPNDVIRGLLGLSVDEEKVTKPGVYLVPHGEFDDTDDLGQWLSDELANGGEYLVASQHYWRNVIPDSICLFQKKMMIVGEGKMVGGLMPYSGSEISPQTGRRYAGIVHFDPISIVVYKKLVTFSEAEKLLGKTLTFRGMQKLTSKDYSVIQKASAA
jgi:hypothetical protein